MKSNNIKNISLKDIGIFSMGRKNSFRVKNKLLKKFNNTTLTDIVLKKLKIFGTQSFFAAHEKEFKNKCNKHKIRFVERNYESANIDGPITKILNFLKNEKYEKFIIINACVPFLKIQTIKEFINFCLKQPELPAFSIIKKNNFFLDEKKKPVNFNINIKTINTKKTHVIYEFAHSLYYFDKKFFFKNKRYWNYNNLRYFEIKNKLEQIDIDTNQDFEISKTIYKNNYAK
jgi:CMP-N-acetylneuraminic acid synthetase